MCKKAKKINSKRINIYINLILIIIIITIIILWESFPARVVGPAGVCAGSRGLLKRSQPGSYWNVGKCWKRCRRRSGVGGYSAGRITV